MSILWLPLVAAIAAAVIDLRSREIPDSLSVGSGVAGLLAAVAGFLDQSGWTSFLSILVVFVVSVIAAWRGGFGGGDVKLLAGLAAWLSLPSALAMLFWTAIAGAALSIAAAARGKDDLAYGPAIAMGFGTAALLPSALPQLVVWMRQLLGLTS